MGYRSTVGIALPTEKLNELIANNDRVAELVNVMEPLEETVNGDKITFLYHDAIKWDTAYEGVRELDDLMCSLDDDQYGFIRIGEESSDIETQGTPWDFAMELNIDISLPRPVNNRNN